MPFELNSAATSGHDRRSWSTSVKDANQEGNRRRGALWGHWESPVRVPVRLETSEIRDFRKLILTPLRRRFIEYELDFTKWNRHET